MNLLVKKVILKKKKKIHFFPWFHHYDLDTINAFKLMSTVTAEKDATTLFYVPQNTQWPM